MSSPPSTWSNSAPAAVAGQSSPPSLPPLASIFATRVFTLPHIPKGARDAWAGIFSQELKAACSSPLDAARWSRLFMLPKCILLSPTVSNRRDWRITLQLVRERLRLWSQGSFDELWDAVLEEADKIRGVNRSTASANISDVNVRRSKRALEDGQCRKAIQALSSRGLAPDNDQTFQALLDLHPQSPSPSLPSSSVPPSATFTASTVLVAVDSFPKGSSPGPSGLRPSHLHEAAHCPSSTRSHEFVEALTVFCQMASCGNIPPDFIPYFCGATLIASLKKNGGVRPIAIGEVLRRLVSKCLIAATLPQAIECLSPLQLGVGIPRASQAIIHAVNIHLSSPSSNAVKPTLLVDFSNAFNSIDRSAMFSEIRQRLPSLSAWFESCYGSAPVLQYKDRLLSSCMGVQQGDPLGPLGFALTLLPVVEQLSTSIPSLKLNLWYLDDGVLSGDIDSLHQAVNFIESVGPSRGLHLNRSKCLLSLPQDLTLPSNPLPPEIPVTSAGFTLLGAPIGPSSFLSSSLSHTISNLSQTLSLLPALHDSQMETTLLRSCFSLSKLSTFLHTCNPTSLTSFYESFDSLILSSLSESIGAHLSQWSWLKASLPVAMGGLGLRKAATHSGAAYYSSLHNSSLVLEEILGSAPDLSPFLDSCRPLLSQAAARPDWITHQDLDTPITQHSLSSAIDKATFSSLLAQAPDVRSRALALSSSVPHSGDWLSVVPSRQLGLHFLDQEFRLCVQYWLGFSSVSSTAPCSVCASPVEDGYGDHQVGCRGNRDLIRRHDSLRDVIFAAAQAAALAPRKEVPALIPGSCARPADVFLPQWDGGRPAALDVTVISSLQALTVADAAVGPQAGSSRRCLPPGWCRLLPSSSGSVGWVESYSIFHHPLHWTSARPTPWA